MSDVQQPDVPSEEVAVEATQVEQPTPPQPDTPIYEIVVINPDRRLHIAADSKEAAQADFNALKESAGITDESTIVSFEVKKQ